MLTRATRGTASTSQPIQQRQQRVLLLLPGLVVLLPVAALLVVRRFDGLYGQDAFAYYDYAVGPLRQSLLALRVVPPPEFYWPPGFPALVAMASLALGATPLAAQVVSLLMGTAAAVATAALTRELFHDEHIGVALLAGGFVAVCAQVWQSSAVVMSDTTALACATLGAWASVRYTRTGDLRWLVLASVALTWSLLTRWIYGLAVLPVAVAVIAGLGRLQPRRAALHVLAAVVPGGLLLVWVLVPVLQSAPGVPQPFIGTLETYGSEIWRPANLLLREFQTTGHGVVRYPWPNGVYYAVALGHPFMLTPLLSLLAIPGVVLLVRRRAWRALWLLLGWTVGMYLFHAGSTWQNLRYVLAYLPPVAIVAAVGASRLLQATNPRLMMLARAGIGLGIVWALVGGPLLTSRFVDQKNGDLATVEWVQGATEPHARLLTFGPTLVLRHYGQHEALDLYDLQPDELPALLADGRPTYVLLDEANVEDQWRGRSPAVNYAWLRDHPGLEPVGRQAGMSLFRVSQS
ncbi:MAG TPA: glycosyltransferase family 39 protein [Chloroflexota bacterium]